MISDLLDTIQEVIVGKQPVSILYKVVVNLLDIYIEDINDSCTSTGPIRAESSELSDIKSIDIVDLEQSSLEPVLKPYKCIYSADISRLQKTSVISKKGVDIPEALYLLLTQN